MAGIHQALELQDLFNQVCERIKDIPEGRSYLSPDGRAFVLAFGGDRAKIMHDFMAAVGRYLMKVQHERGEEESARAEALRAFEEWLSKQKV